MCFGTPPPTPTATIPPNCHDYSSNDVPQSIPDLGAIRVTAGGKTDRITYTSGGVTIDVGDNDSNDESYDSCLDSQLFACPAG